MADPLLYNLTVSDVCEEQARRIGEELVAMELAASRGGLPVYPLSSRPVHDGERGVAHFEGPSEQKWSDDAKELGDLSGRFPGKLFELAVSGHPEDECVIYARDGRTCVVEPYRVWPQFDESMLKAPGRK